jgi:hypothetical protein
MRCRSHRRRPRAAIDEVAARPPRSGAVVS